VGSDLNEYGTREKQMTPSEFEIYKKKEKKQRTDVKNYIKSVIARQLLRTRISWQNIKHYLILRTSNTGL
jgi:hypothetical protein